MQFAKKAAGNIPRRLYDRKFSVVDCYAANGLTGQDVTLFTKRLIHCDPQKLPEQHSTSTQGLLSFP